MGCDLGSIRLCDWFYIDTRNRSHFPCSYMTSLFSGVQPDAIPHTSPPDVLLRPGVDNPQTHRYVHFSGSLNRSFFALLISAPQSLQWGDFRYDFLHNTLFYVHLGFLACYWRIWLEFFLHPWICIRVSLPASGTNGSNFDRTSCAYGLPCQPQA